MKCKVMGICAVILFAMGISGCEKKQIFEEKDAEYKLQAITDVELTEDIYYVKEGSDFYSVYDADGTASNVVTAPAPARVKWLHKDEELIPTLYRNELIAFPSEDTALEKVVLERFYDNGYTLGIYGMEFDADGYLCFSASKNTVDGSDAAEKFREARSDSIRIITINGTPVDESMINDSGIFIGLEKDEEYEITFYTGTYYGTFTIKSDRHILSSYEVLNIDKACTTKNGYLAIYMPENLKSGYYMINGEGMFKYYDFEKGNENLTEVDMNIAYYESEAEKISAYSQNYFASVETKTYNAEFKITYEEGMFLEEDITAYLIAPDGTKYNMDVMAGVITIDLAEVMAGRWQISIMPQNLPVTNVEVISSQQKEDAICETKSFYIGENDENVQFCVSYTGDGEIWATVESSDGQTQMLEVNEKEHILTYTYKYLAADTYTVNVYHYVDTKIEDIKYQYDQNNIMEEIIRVEE